MSILDLIKEDESLEYISLKEAINLLAEKTKSSVYEVAVYLLHEDVHSCISCHIRGLDHKMSESSTASYDGAGWIGENGAFSWLMFISKHEKYLKNFSVSVTTKYNRGCEENFWKRTDFFNLPCIKNLNLLNNKELNLNKQNRYIWDSNYLIIQDLNAPPLLDINEDECLIGSFSVDDIDYPIGRWINEPAEQIKKFPLYFKNKTFSVHEAACLMAGYDPCETQWDYQNINWLLENPEYERASSFMFSAVRTSLFEEFSNGEYFITSVNLRKLLKESDHFIDGFSDYLAVDNDTSKQYQQENEQLLTRIEQLEKELYQEKSQSFLLESDNQLSQLETEKLKESITEKDLQIGKLKKDIEKEKQVSFESWVYEDAVKKENYQLKARIVELERQQNNPTEIIGLNGIQAINQHKKDLAGMARIIANKQWKDDSTISTGTMADTVYREVAKYTDAMPDTTNTVKNWIKPVAPMEAQKPGRPSNKKLNILSVN